MNPSPLSALLVTLRAGERERASREPLVVRLLHPCSGGRLVGEFEALDRCDG